MADIDEKTERDFEQALDYLDKMHARARNPTQRKIIEDKIAKVKTERADLRAAAELVDVTASALLSRDVVRVAVRFELKHKQVVLRGADEWSRAWLDTAPGVDAVLAEMTKRLEGRKMKPDAPAVTAIGFTPPTAPARPTVAVLGFGTSALAASMRHSLDKSDDGTETPSTIAFYLQGAFSRAFPALRFEVTAT